MKREGSWIVGVLMLLIATGAGAGRAVADEIDELIRIALKGGPPHITRDAAVAIRDGETGELVEVRAGTNGFTCLPKTNPNVPKSDPICGDEQSLLWLDSLLKGDPEPANTLPGVAYMLLGTQHWEKNGRIIGLPEPGARLVNDPPHWMLIWPFHTATTGLPAFPNAGDLYILFEDTPYAHLIIMDHTLCLDDAEATGSHEQGSMTRPRDDANPCHHEIHGR